MYGGDTGPNRGVAASAGSSSLISNHRLVTDPDPAERLIGELIAGDRDPRISDIFYFFEALTTLATGRTVGRKIGVVQEIMLKKYLEADEQLRRRMYLEQMLEGRSGAAHKVEFSWYAIAPSGWLRVGAEVVPGLSLGSVLQETEKIRLEGPWEGRAVAVAVDTPTPRTGPLRSFLDERELDLRVTSIREDEASIDIVDRSTLLASLESKRVGAQRFSGSDKLGSGIQTIEKAKQASLVAIDLDLQHNDSVKPLEPSGEKRLLSFVALGNGVHWTDKDKAVVGTYVDYTFLVRDAGIIRYAEYVRDLVGEENFLDLFMDYFQGMTKQEPDDFLVGDDDFEIIVPPSEERPLRTVLADHVARVNPI